MTRASWFVGLVVSAPTLSDALATSPAHVRLQHGDDLHATLAFLGSVSEDAAHAGWRALSIALAPRDVVLGRVVPLGSEKNPSALAALIDDAAIRDAIGSARDAICDAAKAARELRPPLAHLTLARLVKGATPDERQVALAWAAELTLDLVPSRIERVALYTSAADRTERRYRIVASRALL